MIIPAGYQFAATYAGIRKQTKDDLALIVSRPAATAAAVFTQNRAKAAPVVLAQKHLTRSRGRVSALLINAGNANCATPTAMSVALATARAAAQALRVPVTQVLPSSTGVIGVPLDPRKITRALPRLVEALSPGAFQSVAEAIMTTDLVPKVASAEVALQGGTVTISGMTKGSGMIQPLMATTLGFILTDAALPVTALRRVLHHAADLSYNRLSVDGDTSTNDTLVLLANGASGVAPTAAELPLFTEAVTKVAQSLAAQIARDGEGARKLITIDVAGARSDSDATRLARAIANSPLVKTAIAGSDPNWGRILSAAGNAQVPFAPRSVSIWLQGVLVCEAGFAAPFSEKKLKKLLDAPDCSITFKLRGGGPGACRFWTCDLTEGYIRINASYRT